MQNWNPFNTKLLKPFFWIKKTSQNFAYNDIGTNSFTFFISLDLNFNQTYLTHYSPVLLFYTPWKHQKTFRFSDVFRGYIKATLGCNGLIKFHFLTCVWYIRANFWSTRTSRFLLENLLENFTLIPLVKEKTEYSWGPIQNKQKLNHSTEKIWGGIIRA